MTHGFQTNFMNIAPPENDDLYLLKVTIIKETKIYNNTRTKPAVKTSEWSDSASTENDKSSREEIENKVGAFLFRVF